MPGGLIAGTARLRDPMLCTSKSRYYQEYVSAEAMGLQMNAGEKQGDGKDFPSLFPFFSWFSCQDPSRISSP